MDILFAFKTVGGVCLILGIWYITSYFIIPYYKALYFVDGFFSNTVETASVVERVSFNPQTKVDQINDISPKVGTKALLEEALN